MKKNGTPPGKPGVPVLTSSDITGQACPSGDIPRRRDDKIPTVRLCDFLSLTAAATGICAALAYFIPRSITIESVVLSLLIILGFFTVAAVLRILGIIGQNLFNLNAKMRNLEDTLKNNKDDLKSSIESSIEGSIKGSINDFRKDAGENASRIGSILDQVNCDTRDINEGIRQIKVFFEEIERHLNLKK